MEITSNISGSFAWDCQYDKSSDTWIAICDELKLTTWAKNEEDLPEEIELLLGDALDEALDFSLSIELSENDDEPENS